MAVQFFHRNCMKLTFTVVSAVTCILASHCASNALSRAGGEGRFFTTLGECLPRCEQHGNVLESAAGANPIPLSPSPLLVVRGDNTYIRRKSQRHGWRLSLSGRVGELLSPGGFGGQWRLACDVLCSLAVSPFLHRASTISAAVFP